MRATEIISTFVSGGGSGGSAGTNKPATPLGFVIALVRILRALLLALNSVYVAFSYTCFYVLLRPTLGLISPTIFWNIEAQLFQTALAIVASWLFMGDVDLIETVETESVFEEPSVLIANHQETGDVAVLMGAAVGNSVAGRMTWIMDSLFKFTQFGLVSAAHGDLFVQEGRRHRDSSVKEVNKLLRRRFASRRRMWCVIFPEGGLLWKRRAGSHKFAREHNLPILNHVALPRVGAFKATVDAIRHDVKSVVDVTIGYKKDRPLTMVDVLTAALGKYPVHLHYRRFDIASVPNDTEGMTQWLYDRFVEKERLLEEFYATGSFVSGNVAKGRKGSGSAPHVPVATGPASASASASALHGRREALLRFPPWYLVAIQLFWATTAFAWYSLLCRTFAAVRA